MSLANDSADKSRNRSQWKKVSEYAIRNPPWQISKSYVDGCTMYVVWKDGVHSPVAYRNDLDEAFDWIGEQA